MTLDELYEKMIAKAARISAPPGLRTDIVLDVTGEPPRRWLVRFDAGAVSVGPPQDGEPDVTVTAGAETLLRVAQRELNPVMAFLTGKIKVKGDSGLLEQLKHVWPD
ncbi:MAG: SCP2 sterol-binding domain-containing protein [Deltaproteobacteria bacterium]|jgi:putative sterol carrier protein|nr:SCP2 sterol-binding domain-containing protein [Deltaproteobacteria bacterium]